MEQVGFILVLSLLLNTSVLGQFGMPIEITESTANLFVGKTVDIDEDLLIGGHDKITWHARKSTSVSKAIRVELQK
ncbi:MAG: hypothetical protein JKY53_01625 [Flavobacteriales bacterium]|nr:hypothetical protein [Flavobacteriales bacterium]